MLCTSTPGACTSFACATGLALAGTLPGIATTAAPTPAVGDKPSPSKPTATQTDGFVPGGGLPALPASLVETIRKGSFIEFGDLLPESIFEAFVNAGEKDKDKKRWKPPPIEGLCDWMLAYTTWANTIVATDPSRDLPLFQYLGVIGHLARDNPLQVRMSCDKLWDELNFQFMQWAKQEDPPGPSNKEVCNRWNDGRYCKFSLCNHEHRCLVCGKSSHWAAYCPSGRPALSIPPGTPGVHREDHLLPYHHHHQPPASDQDLVNWHQHIAAVRLLSKF